MPSLFRCGRCGKALDAGAADGLCPACLILDGLNAPAQSSEPVTRQVGATGTLSSMPQQRAFGDYELIEEIARGGMGVVYRARQVSLNRTVAVKLILSGQLAGPADVQRFRREAEAAANLQHPNIVAIHEVGEHEGHHYFSMDFVQGQNLAALVKEGPLPGTHAATLVQTIAEAIHYAHTKGVLHRDLKPGNILLDEQGQPRVTDFGLAKRLAGSQVDARQSELTVSGQVLGTPSFMPPEQALGKREQIGPACDVYSLGAILYCLLTARAPFLGQTLEETLALVLGDEPIPPSRLNPAVPRDLETICLKCLEKEPARRYATAHALARDLGRFLNHEPVQATPPTALYRWRKFSRKHRTAVTAAAAILVSLVSATVVSMLFGLRANHERGRAMEAEARATEKAADAQVVLGFLRDNVLAAARPEGREGGLGWDVTVRRAVETAEPRVALLFTNRPVVEAQIRDAIGATFHYLGDYTNAIRQLERALSLREATVGRDHTDTLTSMQNLADALRAGGQLSNAVQVGETLLQRSTRLLAPESVEHLGFMNQLAATYREIGRLSNSIELLEKVWTTRTVKLGTDDPMTLNSASNLAEAYRAAGRFPDALRLRQEILERSRKVRGPTHLDTLTEMSNLALAYRDAGQASNALPLMEEAFRLLKIQTPDHPHTLSVMSSLGTLYRESGRIEEAMPLLEESLKQAIATQGRGHLTTVAAMNSLALAYLDRGQASNAVPLFREALEAQKTRLGPGHLETLALMNNLATAYQAIGQSDDALKLWAETAAATQGKITAQHPQAAAFLNNLASSHLLAGHSEVALPLYEKLLKLADGTFGSDSLNTLALMNNLAAIYERTNRQSDALALREKVVQLATNRLETGHPFRVKFIYNLGSAYVSAGRLSDAIPLLEQTLREARPTRDLETKEHQAFTESLAAAYAVTNRWAQAEPLLQQLLAAQRKSHSAEGPTIAATLGKLADALLGQEKFAEAEPVLQEWVNILTKKQPGVSPTFKAQGSLGLALLRLKKFAEAEPHLVQAYEGLNQRYAAKPSPARAVPIQEARQRLVQLYDAWGKPEKAAALRATVSP